MTSIETVSPFAFWVLIRRYCASETQDGETPEGWSAFQARAFWKSASNAEESSRTIVAWHNSSVNSSLSESSGSSPSAGCSAGSHPCGAPCDVFVESKCQAPFGIQFRPLARCAEVYWALAVPTHKRLSIILYLMGRPRVGIPTHT